MGTYCIGLESVVYTKGLIQGVNNKVKPPIKIYSANTTTVKKSNKNLDSNIL